jgi:TRAP-type transport system periplasmic protein
MMIVDPPPAKMMAEFKEIGDVMTQEWLKTAGPDGKKILDEFHAKRRN